MNYIKYLSSATAVCLLWALFSSTTFAQSIPVNQGAQQECQRIDCPEKEIGFVKL